MLKFDEIFIINIVYFHFSSKTFLCWIIVQDDKKSISFRFYSNEPNLTYVNNEMYSYICLCVFPVL